jgi:hypothetical protein
VQEIVSPHGGYEWVIVVDPSHRNENDLKVLGGQLKEAIRDDRYVQVYVYDDRDAASQRAEVPSGDLSDEDREFQRRHLIGSFLKDDYLGSQVLTITLEGAGRDATQVPF